MPVRELLGIHQVALVMFIRHKTKIEGKRAVMVSEVRDFAIDALNIHNKDQVNVTLKRLEARYLITAMPCHTVAYNDNDANEARLAEHLTMFDTTLKLMEAQYEPESEQARDKLLATFNTARRP